MGASLLDLYQDQIQKNRHWGGFVCCLFSRLFLFHKIEPNEIKLFNLTLFEVHMFADNGVVFLFDHFFGHGAGVLFCDVKIARIRCAI